MSLDVDVKRLWLHSMLHVGRIVYARDSASRAQMVKVASKLGKLGASSLFLALLLLEQ